ncbi:MAG: acyltransferase [Defluviicoccus sp.]|nr:acyltransferase [Defluviicoccus sp.]MDE0276747.1 acyltransferase [Defluviicoccus sp.]
MQADRTAHPIGWYRSPGRAIFRYLDFEDRPGENPWLDLLRCAAIGLVLARHGHRAWIESAGAEPAWFDFIMLNGWMGVDLFFVLSGYLVGRILLRQGGGLGGLSTYLRRRALRILPAYYAVLLATTLGAFPLYGFASQDLGQRLLYHLAMLQDYLSSDINVVFWSLGVEVKFYLLAPFILLLAARARSPGTLLCLLGVLVLLSTAVRLGIVLERGPPVDYAAFIPVFRHPAHAVGEPLMLGAAAAVLGQRGLLRLGPRAAARLLGASAAAITGLAMSHELMADISIFDIVFQPLLIALLFAAAVAAGAALSDTHLPCARAARIGARLAYPLYLTHFPLLPLSLAVAHAFDGAAAAFWTVFLGLSVASALAVHYAFEKPFLIARPTQAAAVRER